MRHDRLTLIDTEVELADALDLLDECITGGSEVPSDLRTRIMQYVENRMDRVDAVGGFIANLKRQQSMIGQEVQRLKTRSERFGRVQEHVEKYVMDAMAIGSNKKLVGDKWTITRVEGVPRVVVTDQHLLPESAWREPPPREKVLDLAGLRERLKAGEFVPGAELGRGDPFLKVY